MANRMQQTTIIQPLTEKEYERWDQYVDQHPEGSFFHLSGWIRVITQVFRHKPHYLMAVQAGKIVGVLPLVQQKSMLFGHALISTPFCVYGGVIADNDEIRMQLESEAYLLGCELNVDYVELRDRYQRESKEPWQVHCHHSTFSCPIANTPDEILTSIKRKQRAVVRHSFANELSWDEHDDPDLCYDVYAESVRNLGTPVFNKKLFRTLKETFGERCHTLIIRDKENQPVSSVLSFYYKDAVLPYYGGGKFEARELKSYDYMYYQLMCLAHEKGKTQFDFGRSKHDSGSYSYKKNWGMQEELLHYKIALVKSDSLPNLSPNNPKYRLFINLWKRMPLGVSRAIGPNLSKYLG